ncbi:MAG: HAD family hydrolase, partial [Clostridia bacterium]|nr:HAD family hydrolase [Clostridia bacterium]
SSAEAGCTKPDRAIFELALKAAGCEAEESVMVGDRLDNDMLPAKEIGMKTVWIRTGLSKVQPLTFGKGIYDIQIESLRELTLIFE